MGGINDAKLRIFWSECYQLERIRPLPKSLSFQITYCTSHQTQAHAVIDLNRGAVDFTNMDEKEGESGWCTRAGQQIGYPALVVNHVPAPSSPCLMELYQKCSI